VVLGLPLLLLLLLLWKVGHTGLLQSKDRLGLCGLLRYEDLLHV
jgi:hypothetical protein